MLSRRGARVMHGPTMTTELLGDVDATLAATAQLLSEPVDLVVLTTGIGVRSWFGAAESVGMEEALRTAFDGVEVVARGPKAQSAARHVGLEVTWTAPTETNDEILARLEVDGIAEKRVVVQRDGGEPLFADRPRGPAAARGRRRPGLPLAHAGGRGPGRPPARRRDGRAGRRGHVHVVVRRPQRVRDRPRPGSPRRGVRPRRARRRRGTRHGRVPASVRRDPRRRAGAGTPRLDDPGALGMPGAAGSHAHPRGHVAPLAGDGADRRRPVGRSSSHVGEMRLLASLVHRTPTVVPEGVARRARCRRPRRRGGRRPAPSEARPARWRGSAPCAGAATPARSRSGEARWGCRRPSGAGERRQLGQPGAGRGDGPDHQHARPGQRLDTCGQRRQVGVPDGLARTARVDDDRCGEVATVAPSRRPAPAPRMVQSSRPSGRRACHRARASVDQSLSVSTRWPETIVTWALVPRSVTAIPARAGAPSEEEMPGTTSTSTPAASAGARLLHAATEQERVATLEAHDARRRRGGR